MCDPLGLLPLGGPKMQFSDEAARSPKIASVFIEFSLVTKWLSMNCYKVSGLTKVSFSRSFLGTVCFCHKLGPVCVYLSGPLKSRGGSTHQNESSDKMKNWTNGQPSSLCRQMRRFCLGSTVVHRANASKPSLLWRWPLKGEERYHFLYSKTSDRDACQGSGLQLSLFGGAVYNWKENPFRSEF